ncbi:MAG: hypothetical protein SCJ94_11890 [Bacillota bacterium]|nr:hypothetical protein [Bacillota bacterium]
MLEAILQSLESVKATRKGYIARCPAHDDRSPSLSVTQGDDGRILLYCFAGCTINDICEALSIQPVDLFPDTRKMKPEIKRRYSEAQKQWKLIKRFEQLENQAFVAIAEFRDLTQTVFDYYKFDIDDETAKAVHMLPLIQHYMDIITTGTQEERLELLRIGVLHKWAKLYNSQKKMNSF